MLTREQVVAIRRMRVRMEEERVRPRGAGRYHFKLGYGGLADVQFAVELALMREGAAHPDVRRTRTVEALEALAAERLLEDSVALSLSEAFVFLTTIKASLELDHRSPGGGAPHLARGPDGPGLDARLRGARPAPIPAGVPAGDAARATGHGPRLLW